MKADKKVNAKVRPDGSLIVKLDEQPGCIQAVTVWIEKAVRYVFIFLAGALVGILIENIWK
jgi:hypothetical protein